MLPERILHTRGQATLSAPQANRAGFAQ